MAVSDIKTPSITTLSIEVKVIKIGKKQCTIAVFKQLPTLRIVHDLHKDESWNIWGHVIYNDDYYVVIEDSGVLKKGLMPTDLPKSKDFNSFVAMYDFTTDLKGFGYLYSAPEYWFDRKNFDKNIFHLNSFGRLKNPGNVEYLLNELNKNREGWEESLMEIYQYSRQWNEFCRKCRTSDQLFIAV